MNQVVEELFGDGIVNDSSGIKLTLSMGKKGAGHIRHTAVGINTGTEKQVLIAAFDILPQLVKEAQKVKTTDGRKGKDELKRGTEGSLKYIHRFLIPVRCEERIYILKLTAKEYHGNPAAEVDIDDADMITAKLYDQNVAKVISEASSASESDKALYRPTLKLSDIMELSIGEMAVNVKDTIDAELGLGPYLTVEEYEEQTGRKYPFNAQEGEFGIRGMYRTDAESGQRIISMFKAQNSSTFFHEIGHVFLDDLELMAGHEKAGDQIRQDWQTIRNWLGFEDGQTKATREQHEKFADGFLNYLNEGKAPSNALQSAFERFKNWLSHLFESGDIDKVEMSDAVREVYDRLTGKKDAIMADSDVNMVNDGGANTSPESNDSPVSELKTGQDGKIQRELEELRQYIQNELANDSEVGGRLGLDGEYGDAATELLLARARVLAEREGISPLAWGKRLLVGSNARYDSESDMYRKPRGRLTGLSGGKYLLSLFKTANRSTFFHETAHFFLDDLRMMAKTEGVSETTLSEWNGTLEWLGVADIDFDNMTESDVKRWKDAQEKFAAAFNKYQMEGKAPTSTLQSLFDKFKEWLTAVFESVENITYTDSEGNRVGFEMNDDIRGVFDSMLNKEGENDDIIGKKVDTTDSDTLAKRARKYSDAEIAKILDDLKTHGIKENPLRQAYEQEVKNLAGWGEELLKQGQSVEEVARTLYQARRDLGEKYKNITPQPLRDYIYEYNRDRHDDPLGVSFEVLLITKSLEEVIESAARPDEDVNRSLLSGFKDWLRRQ